MLSVRDLHAYYGKSHILQGVNLEVGGGEIVSLLGRNGVGRSTTCKAIMGLVEPVGEVIWKGQSLAGQRADVIAHAGIGYVPEDRQVFPTLTVRQNLELGLKQAGLAPMLVAQVGRFLDEIARRGVSILLVEQKLTIALKISHRVYVMGHGRIVFEGTPAALAANAAVRKENLEV